MTTRKQIHIRLGEDTFTKVTDFATANHISANAAVELMLRSYGNSGADLDMELIQGKLQDMSDKIDALIERISRAA